MAASGETVTYGELEARSNQGAHLFRNLGIGAGDAIALFLDNGPRYYEILWAAQRSGVRFTCISSKLTAGEVEYIVKDCEAKAFIASASLADAAVPVAGLIGAMPLFMVDGEIAPFKSFETARATFPKTPIADESAGGAMLYSSGTTGRPKGVKRSGPMAAAGPQPIDAPNGLSALGAALYGINFDTVYLSPAPLYHAAPLGWSMGVQALGGTVVVMERFDAEAALQYIEAYRVTCAQWVPTHFVRMLKLPHETRAKYDLSSLKSVFHAAAPCPVPVKEQMIAWWGPIIHEYYAGTEGNGFCVINSEEWLRKKGSVGRSILAQVKICDEAGEELPPRAEGGVYFAGGGEFEYHNAPEKTAESRNHYGWTTLGDVGLAGRRRLSFISTDRKSFMIISRSGVNIYPQEIENLHPSPIPKSPTSPWSAGRTKRWERRWWRSFSRRRVLNRATPWRRRSPPFAEPISRTSRRRDGSTSWPSFPDTPPGSCTSVSSATPIGARRARGSCEAPRRRRLKRSFGLPIVDERLHADEV